MRQLDISPPDPNSLSPAPRLLAILQPGWFVAPPVADVELNELTDAAPPTKTRSKATRRPRRTLFGNQLL